MDAKCSSCRFFNATSVFLDGYLAGECRVRSPVASEVSKDHRGYHDYRGIFPIVFTSGWCGEFSHKETGAGLQ